MAKKKWCDLSTAQRSAIVVGAAVDAGLRVWALGDLAGRAPSEVNGPKWLWATGLSVVNSAGVLPAAYLLTGRAEPDRA
ncbi:hypothetical protein MYK68_17025 [Gordonia sp. PP30]|uniref:hypothetical protein n=1 Tax=Gordonia sp. PP30 TaxID=2935861 RepID=UPI001FFF2ACE|nr:hypothetical protein [Gordonia sp. PP30]UQE74404.1 hypothetical protein MYK68_17025 [Gordonia sp. PP30]